MYNLPNAHELLDNTPTKLVWKKQVLTEIHIYWNVKLQGERNTQSTVRFLSDQSLNLGQPAALWSSALDSRRDTEKAFVKAKVLTGTYHLQAIASKFTNKLASPICQLCYKEPEDRAHFMLGCETLDQFRKPHRAKLIDVLNETDYQHGLLPLQESKLLQLLLDPSSIAELRKDEAHSIESFSRDWIYHLHLCRWRLLGLEYSKKKLKKTNSRTLIIPKKITSKVDKSRGKRRVLKVDKRNGTGGKASQLTGKGPQKKR